MSIKSRVFAKKYLQNIVCRFAEMLVKRLSYDNILGVVWRKERLLL
jgi:hypothetical protein